MPGSSVITYPHWFCSPIRRRNPASQPLMPAIKSSIAVMSSRLIGNSKSRQRLAEPLLAGFEFLHERPSSALWSVLRADRASCRSRRRIQCHGGAN